MERSRAFSASLFSSSKEISSSLDPSSSKLILSSFFSSCIAASIDPGRPSSSSLSFSSSETISFSLFPSSLRALEAPSFSDPKKYPLLWLPPLLAALMSYHALNSFPHLPCSSHAQKWHVYLALLPQLILR